MLMILIDTLVLMVLLKAVNDENVEFVSAIIVAVITAITTAALATALSLVIGIWGVVLAGILAAVGLGLAVSTLFGVEIKRSMLIGAIFILLSAHPDPRFYRFYHRVTCCIKSVK